VGCFVPKVEFKGNEIDGAGICPYCLEVFWGDGELDATGFGSCLCVAPHDLLGVVSSIGLVCESLALGALRASYGKVQEGFGEGASGAFLEGVSVSFWIELPINPLGFQVFLGVLFSGWSYSSHGSIFHLRGTLLHWGLRHHSWGHGPCFGCWRSCHLLLLLGFPPLHL